MCGKLYAIIIFCMGETWSSGSCSIHGPGHVDAECPGQAPVEIEAPTLGEHHRTIETLLNKLDSVFYRGEVAQREAELGSLADEAMAVLIVDPNLEQSIPDKKSFKAWETLTRVLYKGLQKTDSDEMFEKISDTLALVLKVADRQTNTGPADSLVTKKLFDTWPWSDLENKPKRTRDSDRNEVILRKYVAQFGLDAETMFKAWYASKPIVKVSLGGEYDHPVNIAEKSLLEMRRLELAYPGGPQTLANEFGVHCFIRYPQGLLDNQLAQIDDVTTPYGLIIGAASDHNGYHYKKGSRDAFKSVSDQCEGLGINLRVIEVSSQRDTRKKFFNLENRYNIPGNQKAVFGIVCGHADQEGIALGQGGSPGNSVDIKDIQTGNFVADSKRFFADGANIVIDGCLVGENGGFAQKVS